MPGTNAWRSGSLIWTPGSSVDLIDRDPVAVVSVASHANDLMSD